MKGEKVFLSFENIKSEVKEILWCSFEGLSEEDLCMVLIFWLNYEDVFIVWFDRGELWVNFENFMVGIICEFIYIF